MSFPTRTETTAPARKRARWMVAAILLLAAGLRLWHLDFGLPALNDPDEPIFAMTALDMLREGRLNPGWFGHPATLLFYLLAIVLVAVAAVGWLAGNWSDSASLVAALYADPGIAMLPMRGLSVVLGIASVWLTWRIGQRVGGERTGLIAALLLSVCALHVEYSQLIRTDMLATVLMGWSLLHALAIAEAGRLRDHIWAGVAAGLACATKWPALLVLAAPALATLWRMRTDRGAWKYLPLAPAVAAITLAATSPYLLLDWKTVLRDLSGEARPVHLGATGYGLAGNLGWYLRGPLLQSFGLAGLLLAALGCVGLARDRAAALVLLPIATLLWLALAAQSLVWARWIVPLLPLVAILAAIGLGMIADRLRAGPLATTAAALLIATSMGIVTISQTRERARDPRQAATAWVRAHVPAGRTILVEHAAFDLLPYRGRLLFPLGSAGCIDVRGALASRLSHRQANRARTGRAIVDLGNVDPARLASCDADVAILSNAARYRREAERFPAQAAVYRDYLTGRRLSARLGSGEREVEIYVRQSFAAAPDAGRR